MAPHTYSLAEIASVFHDAGFAVGLKRLNYRDFFSWNGPDFYMHTPTELLDFMYRDMVMFRLTAPS